MTGRPGQTRPFAKEKERRENIWLDEEKKNREGKGRKYLEKENIWPAEEKKAKRKRRKLFKEGKNFTHTVAHRGKEEWRSKRHSTC